MNEETMSTPPPSSNQTERNWAMGCHLIALAILTHVPFANILGPLILWLIKKDELPVVNQHGKESLNFQISISLYMLICLPLVCFAGLGVLLVWALMIADIILVIIAAVKANQGEFYPYPCTIRFIK